MYFSVVPIIVTTHVDPVQRIPSLFSVTIGVPVVSVTLISTELPAQTGMRLAFSPSDCGSTMLPVMKLRILGLLVGLCPFPMVEIATTGHRSSQPRVAVGVAVAVAVAVAVGVAVAVAVGVAVADGVGVAVGVLVAVGVAVGVGVVVGVGDGAVQSESVLPLKNKNL